MTSIFNDLRDLQDELQRGKIALIDFKYIDNEEFKGHCTTCKTPIIGKATTFTKSDLKYYFHPQCFVCAGCQTSMDGRAFYNHELKYFCADCYHSKVLGRCDACGHFFTDPTVIKAGGRQYHTKCFTCVNCKEALTSVYVEKEDGCLCKSCYEILHLPPCGACGLPITPDIGSDKLMAIEWNDKKFHIHCFACKKCTKPFSDLKAILHDDALFCRPCFDEAVK